MNAYAKDTELETEACVWTVHAKDRVLSEIFQHMAELIHYILEIE